MHAGFSIILSLKISDNFFRICDILISAVYPDKMSPIGAPSDCWNISAPYWYIANWKKAFTPVYTAPVRGFLIMCLSGFWSVISHWVSVFRWQLIISSLEHAGCLFLVLLLFGKHFTCLVLSTSWVNWPLPVISQLLSSSLIFFLF